MKRLTRVVYKVDYVAYTGPGRFEDKSAITALLERLAAYEETGLEPEDIADLLAMKYEMLLAEDAHGEAD